MNLAKENSGKGIFSLSLINLPNGTQFLSWHHTPILQDVTGSRHKIQLQVLEASGMTVESVQCNKFLSNYEAFALHVQFIGLFSLPCNLISVTLRSAQLNTLFTLTV